eukprot:scaffold102403_cov71-Phaeocystis_antarctica.AAC.2
MHVAGLLRPAVLRLVLKRLATRHRLRRVVALVAAAGFRFRLAVRLMGQLLVQVRRAVFMKRKEVAPGHPNGGGIGDPWAGTRAPL